MSEVKKRKIEISSKAFILNPYKEIDDAVGNDDWISAFATAVTFFQYFGAKIIRKRCESLKMEDYSDTVSRMPVSGIIFTLRILDIIDNAGYEKMKEINNRRNDLIHPKETSKITDRYSIQESQAKQLLEEAKKCIRKLAAIN